MFQGRRLRTHRKLRTENCAPGSKADLKIVKNEFLNVSQLDNEHIDNVNIGNVK
jgi:hypothetical protein